MAWLLVAGEPFKLEAVEDKQKVSRIMYGFIVETVQIVHHGRSSEDFLNVLGQLLASDIGR